MPLLNKKPINPAPAVPANLVFSNPDTEVFFIEFTGEIFLTYDEFITRYTLYKKRIWTCEVTGKAGLTYKEAIDSELSARRKYDSKFPEVWRKTALEKIHWNINTLAVLQDSLHEYFKDHIYLGELVGVELGNNEYNAVVVEILVNPNTPNQISYNMKTSPTEPPEAKFCEFIVHLSMGDGQLLDDTDPKCPVRYQFPAAKIKRNRRAMSKQNFKAFVKDSAVKENWIGAPWIVKSDLVRRYKLPVQPPDSVTASSEDKRKKLMESKKKAIEESDQKLEAIQFPIEDLELPIKAPKPPVDESGVAVPDRPSPNYTFYDIPNDMMSLLIQSWYFLGVFGKPICLLPATLDDLGQAVCHRSLNPKCILIHEVFGTLMNIACKYWGSGLDAALVRPLYPAALVEPEAKPDEFYLKYVSQVETMSDDERVAIDQWYKWCPGRWHTEAEAKGGRGPKVDKDHSKRLKAWEVALMGFIKDVVPEEKLPNKWKVLAESEPKELETNGEHVPEPDVPEATSPVSLGIESDNETAGSRRSLRKRKRVIAYSSEEEEEEEKTHVVKGTRSSTRIKAAEADMASEPTQPRPRGRPRTRPSVDIENLISAASKRFTLLEAADKVIRDYLEDAVDKAQELRKERREMGRDHKAVEQARAELDLKEKEKASNLEDGEANGYHNGKENGDGEAGEAGNGYDLDAMSRLSSRVMKLKAEQARREEEEKKRKEEAEKARKEHKEKQKELRKSQEERKKVEESERALLRRQITTEVELRMMMGVSRIQPLGMDRFFNRYWWFDGAFGSLTPEAEALEKIAKKAVKPIGPLEWASGVIFVEDVGFRPESKSKFVDGNSTEIQGQWGYLSDPAQLEQLKRWLDTRGMREMELLSALNHISDAAVLGMRKRAEHLEKSLESISVRRSSRGRHDGIDESSSSYLKYLNVWATHQITSKTVMLIVTLGVTQSTLAAKPLVNALRPPSLAYMCRTTEKSPPSLPGPVTWTLVFTTSTKLERAPAAAPAVPEDTR
ncbi:hypothetical protein BC829DRAFT_486978 [Chytridium lagenaria]|nr:hypothetical protein BC829DRAFT_486978 [Chytridium lagenaria]